MTKDEALKLALEALENNRQTHHYCEDTWYSCPKHEDGCANDAEGDECNCGADKANAEIDATITAIKEALSSEATEMSDTDGAQPEHGWTSERIAGIARLKEAQDKKLAQPEQGYTTKRNEWTNQVTHKCNACGRDDFRSENAAKFHKCEGIEEPKQHSQNKWLNIYTTPPQRTWVNATTWRGLTDEEAQQTFAKHNCTISTHLAGILARAIEAKLKEKNTHD